MWTKIPPIRACAVPVRIPRYFGLPGWYEYRMALVDPSTGWWRVSQGSLTKLRIEDFPKLEYNYNVE